MTKAKSPEIRFEGFDQEWTTQNIGKGVTFLRHNSLSRAQLTYHDTGVQNIHYGDILIKFGSVLNPLVDTIPFVRDPSTSNLGDLLQDGDVVFADAAEDSTVGKCTEIRGSINKKLVAGLHTITARPTKAFGEGYLGHALNADTFHDQLVPLMQGTKVSSISTSALSSCKVSFPEIDEQQEIGSFFSNLDDTIAAHRKKLAKLQQTKTSLLQQMFPQGDAVEPELRIGVFTEPWKAMELGQLGKARAGVGFPDMEQGGGSGIPFYKVSDMNLPGNEREMVKANNYVSTEQIERRHWRPIFDLPAVVFAKVGAAVYLGRKRMVHEPFLVDNNMIGYSINLDEWDVEFARTVFETLDFSALVQTGALPSFNPSAVEEMSVMVPPSIDEQRAIGELFGQLDDLITGEQLYVEKLRQVKASLLHKMFV
ncbi:restriction endonuclease subunit S [Varibaculum vaginae]|uniref:restriction endonuclease subunit S n=1 Tax=Varibaculum vaginae TaxID=2364797 RepID=UPI000F085B99|nr:restriction endonuclease subunit S [Varibaculum vaginae]